jgi:hypothetical protein
MYAFRTAVVLLVLTAGHAAAQPKAGQVQPDRIDFGAVYTGATVEASFLVFEPGHNVNNIALQVTAPKFVKVRHTATHSQEFGPGNLFVCGTVEISLDTAAAGELSGQIAVTLGRSRARVPVSATVKRRRPGLYRLLVVETPFQRYSTAHGGAFKPWTDLVKDASVDVSYLLSSPGKAVFRDLDLGRFDCVLLAETGLMELTPREVTKVRQFAEAGGRVVVAANAFFVGSVKQANLVLNGYGLLMRDEEARGPAANDVTLRKGDLDPEVVKAGVGSVHFFRASPVVVTDEKAARILARAVGVGRDGDGFVAIGRAGKGQVIALGESLWWNWIGGRRADGADNARLLRWLLVPPRRG